MGQRRSYKLRRHEDTKEPLARSLIKEKKIETKIVIEVRIDSVKELTTNLAAPKGCRVDIDVPFVVVEFVSLYREGLGRAGLRRIC